MSSQSPAALTLIVRLWFEASEGDAAESEWRGEIKQVPSGRVSYFRGLEGMIEQVRSIIRQDVGPGG